VRNEIKLAFVCFSIVYFNFFRFLKHAHFCTVLLWFLAQRLFPILVVSVDLSSKFNLEIYFSDKYSLVFLIFSKPLILTYSDSPCTKSPQELEIIYEDYFCMRNPKKLVPRRSTGPQIADIGKTNW